MDLPSNAGLNANTAIFGTIVFSTERGHIISFDQSLDQGEIFTEIVCRNCKFIIKELERDHVFLIQIRNEDRILVDLYLTESDINKIIKVLALVK